MRSARFMLSALVALVVAAGLAVIATHQFPPVASATPRHTPAPPLPTDVMVPPAVTLASLHGTPAVINFWASWCGPCHDEAAGLEQLATGLSGRVTLVGVDWNDGLGGGRSFLNSYHWTFPVLRDADGVVGAAYGVDGLPATFILDANGRIVDVLLGPQTAAGLRAALRRLGLPS